MLSVQAVNVHRHNLCQQEQVLKRLLSGRITADSSFANPTLTESGRSL